MATILLVDDSVTERTLVASALEGHTILQADNGEDAITIAKDRKPDLVILDVVMPGKNGYQTCRELHKMPETSDIPVIMLTSKDLETDKQWGMRQGASDYLTKPFMDDELLKVVGKYV
jgi:twitching motility two-component system response regulator PilH